MMSPWCASPLIEALFWSGGCAEKGRGLLALPDTPLSWVARTRVTVDARSRVSFGVLLGGAPLGAVGRVGLGTALSPTPVSRVSPPFMPVAGGTLGEVSLISVAVVGLLGRRTSRTPAGMTSCFISCALRERERLDLSWTRFSEGLGGKMLFIELEYWSARKGGDGVVRIPRAGAAHPGDGVGSTHAPLSSCAGWVLDRQYAMGSMLSDRWWVPPSGRKFCELQHEASLRAMGPPDMIGARDRPRPRPVLLSPTLVLLSGASRVARRRVKLKSVKRAETCVLNGQQKPPVVSGLLTSCTIHNHE